MELVVVDVETANPDLTSICQIGVALFEQGALADTWQTLVDPKDDFDPWNVAVHGITAEDVRGAPTFPDVYSDLQRVLGCPVVACHTPFDRIALTRGAAKHQLPALECSWLDTARVVRRAWGEYAQRGYGLANVAAALGISFRHHDAAEDARAAGEILLRAVADTGLTVHDWLGRVSQPISAGAGRLARDGNPDGPLAGEVIVFTGALSVPRRLAAELAAAAGCSVADAVGDLTTLLVVGDQDIRKLGGREKSAKHRKAERLIANGRPIRILTESDFASIVHLN